MSVDDHLDQMLQTVQPLGLGDSDGISRSGRFGIVLPVPGKDSLPFLQQSLLLAQILGSRSTCYDGSGPSEE